MDLRVQKPTSANLRIYLSFSNFTIITLPTTQYYLGKPLDLTQDEDVFVLMIEKWVYRNDFYYGSRQIFFGKRINQFFKSLNIFRSAEFGYDEWNGLFKYELIVINQYLTKTIFLVSFFSLFWIDSANNGAGDGSNNLYMIVIASVVSVVVFCVLVCICRCILFSQG